MKQRKDALMMRWKTASARAEAWSVARRKTWMVVVAVVHSVDQSADHDTWEMALGG